MTKSHHPPRQTHRADVGPGPFARADAPVSSHHRRHLRGESSPGSWPCRKRKSVRLLSQVLGEFANRHEQVEDIFRKRFEQVSIYLEPGAQPSPERQMLIGAYFTHEYSPESAALFNPSIVPHPDQSGLPRGALRFILSLRATGEGHISSITFRTGTVSAQHRITLTPPVPFVTEPERVPNAAYDKGLFTHKLEEAGVQNDFCRRVLDQLHDDFTLKELHAVLLASGLTRTPPTPRRPAPPAASCCWRNRITK